MEKQLVEVSNLINSEKDSELDVNSSSLPFLIKGLLLCNNEHVQKGIKEILSGIKNFDLKVESKLAFLTQDYQLAIIVFSGSESETSSEIEKVSHHGVGIILVGDNIPQGLLRKAFQLSIKDFIPLATVESELLPAILNFSNKLSSQANLAPVISIVNGKGGAGASFITNTFAQVLAKHCEHKLALFDADLQHGSLADSLNFKPDYYLDEAIRDVNDLDSTAIDSIMSTRKNLSLLPVRAYSQLNNFEAINIHKVNHLISKLRLNYSLLISDLSRGLDSLSIPILEISEHILIVLQQNITSIREAKALIEQLQHKMGISADKMHIIINRFSDKSSSITVADVKKTTGVDSVFRISNDYELANACTDLGKPLSELSGSNALEKEMLDIINNIITLELKNTSESKGFWAKLTGIG